MHASRSFRAVAFSAALVLVIGARANGEPPPTATPAAVDPESPTLRDELLARFQDDQAVRHKLIALAKEHNMTIESKEFEPIGQPVLQELQKVDADNRQWLTKLIDRHGWPGRTLVGKDGAHAAWLLVQHADRDLAFQKACFDLMGKAPDGEVAKLDVAYLTDRIRLAEGKPQVYGTQAEVKDGRWQLMDVEAPETLDDRRKEVGLEPVEAYLQSIQDLYGTPTGDASRPRDAK